MGQQDSIADSEQFDIEEAAEGVRHFFMEPHASAGLRHLSHSLWRQAETQEGLATLLYAAGERLDLSKETAEADFCRRMAVVVRAYHEHSMDIRGFAVAALRAAGLDVIMQVEIARRFEAQQEAVVRNLPRRLAFEKAWNRRRKLLAFRDRAARLLLRPFGRPAQAI